MDHLLNIRFFIYVLISSVLILVILFIKKLFKKHISIKCQYYIWFLLLVVLAIPIIPPSLLNVRAGIWWLPGGWDVNPIMPLDLASLQSERNTIQSGQWIQDFAVVVSRHAPDVLNQLIGWIWGSGVICFFSLTLFYNYKIRFLKRSINVLKNKEVVYLLKKCKEEMHIKGNIILGESTLIQSPMIFGFFRTYIILPTYLSNSLTDNEIKYILLHELSHYKNRDVFINYILCFYQIIYWFNPLIWFAFNQMRTDREIACDISVLKRLHKNCYIEYGKTIIKFAEKITRTSPLMTAADIIGSKHQIKRRIEKIVSYTLESRHLRIKSLFVFIVLSFAIVTQVFALSTLPYHSKHYTLKSEKVVYEDLSDYFIGVEGTFVLYNLKTQQYTIYNKSQSTMRVSPNSTYKIYSALIGLETHIIQDVNSEIEWDGINYLYESWNKNHKLATAMQDSVSWYFQSIDQKVGLINLNYYFSKLNYGNADLTGGIQEYWLESSLKISAIEQVQLLEKFYKGAMDFDEKNSDTLKSVLKLAQKDGAILSGKTGSGIINSEKRNGWFIGYVEKDGDVNFFATYIHDKKIAGGAAAAKVTMSILENKNIY